MSEVVSLAFDCLGSKVSRLPSNAEVVFGYADGAVSAWTTAQCQAQRAKTRFALITVMNNPHEARIADIERYDMKPVDAPGFVKARNAFSGEHDATLYCNLSTLPEVVQQADKAGEPYWLWVADWTGKPRGGYDLHTGRGTICAQQYANEPDYDVTAIYSAEWLGMLSKPSGRKTRDEAAPAADTGELDGYVVYTNPLGGYGGRAVKSIDNGRNWG